MNELAPTKAVKPLGRTSKDSAAMRGLCADLNSGFLAPGGASDATQKEIKEAMRSDAAFKQPTPTTRVDTPARTSEAPTHRGESEATPVPTALPTSEERAKTMVHNDDIPVVTNCAVETESALPEDEETPTDIGAATDRTINPKYRKVLFTGQMKAGKDYVAKAAGYQILSLAAPLYALLDFFFGITETQKDAPGARDFMQRVGTWGRGDITGTEPLTPERAIFVRMIQSMAGADVLPMRDVVNWGNFGKDQNIWLTACLEQANRIVEADPRAMVAVVNGRFENEIKAFDEAGWARFHVMASGVALKQRREKDGVPAEALQHSSEKLAGGLNQGSIRLASTSRKPKINVVWNDPQAGRPSTKFYSLGEFVSTVRQAEWKGTP